MNLLIISIVILLVSLIFTKIKETYRNDCPVAVSVNCPNKETICPSLKCPGPEYPDLKCPELKCPEPKCPDFNRR